MKTILLGLDAFDPQVFERLLERGQMPNLARYVDKSGYARFEVTNPPQSEVSWTSIATGQNPGMHGIFDFVHRNPATYTPYVSLLPTKKGFGGTQFRSPFTARTIFDHSVQKGYQATALWWPATFPARIESPARILPGLGTPDIHGKLGTGTLFTTDPGMETENLKTPVAHLEKKGSGLYRGALKGPIRKKRSGTEDSEMNFEVEIVDGNCARLRIGSQAIDLSLGQWSPVFEVVFKVGMFYKLRAVTRVILTQIEPELRLYFLPLQIHPLHSPWRYAAPGGFVKRTWQEHGPFLTIGWPQDTTGLEDGCMSDDHFLALADSIFETRERIFMHQLDNFKEGILASVFDTMDRVQHMFWRDRQDVIEAWYQKLDGLVGRVEEKMSQRGLDSANLLIVSDHGFADFDHKAHLNRWLLDHGYLVAQANQNSVSGNLRDVDWTESQAYAIGLNSIYFNMAGREGQGIVAGADALSIREKLKNDLLAWRGPNGSAVVQQVYFREDALSGPLAQHGPDLYVGYAPGYRASAQTGLGQWEAASLEPNHDHWGADHCIDPAAVPGVLFSNQGLQNYPQPSYRDIPKLAVGSEIGESSSAPPPVSDDEDQDVLEERLKSLGYL
ncbi:MAG: alkaline phosphatase family protein [Chloroflexota bacterium]